MARDMRSVELELTYLAAAIPEEIKSVQPVSLKDIYIPDSESAQPRLRLRKRGEIYEITKKLPLQEGDSSRHEEATISLTRGEFLALEGSGGKVIEKDRYVITLDGYRAEVDVFSGSLKGLILIEFEFDNEAAISSFVPPTICSVDVTQEDFIAGGLLAGKSYSAIESNLKVYGYHPLYLQH